jgi:hypothetical protein
MGDETYPVPNGDTDMQCALFVGLLFVWPSVFVLLSHGPTFLRPATNFEIFDENGAMRILYPDKCPDSSTASKRSRVFATYLTLGGRIRSL